MYNTWNKTDKTLDLLHSVAEQIERKLVPYASQMSGEVYLELNELRSIWNTLEQSFQVITKYAEKDPDMLMLNMGFTESGHSLTTYQPFYLRRKDGAKIYVEHYINLKACANKINEAMLESLIRYE